jgi:hypothetical protein
MKTMKLYWLRFLSKTPEMLAKLQKFFGAIAVGCAGAIVVMQQYGMTESSIYDILTHVAVACAFAVPILQFATADKQLQKETPETI